MSKAEQQKERVGPRPLGLHLQLANLCLLTSFLGLNAANSGSPLWSEALSPALDHLRKALQPADAGRFAHALVRVIEHELTAFTHGVSRYRTHTYRRRLGEPPVRWQEGSVRLLDYGAANANVKPGAGPVLFVPSLINPAYILDLSARRSLLRHLAKHGLHPYLLDWGRPGEHESTYDLADYICGPLRAAIRYLTAHHGAPVQLVGYCMGGTLTLAAAVLWPQDIAQLSLLAAPWDFHANGLSSASLLSSTRDFLAQAHKTNNFLSVDWLQACFLSLDPALGLKKFVKFAALPDGEAAEDFVALEDWLNDGPDLAMGVARDCLIGWYADNLPGRGRWRISKHLIDPRAVQCPTLLVIPTDDRIVPPAFSRPLAHLIPKIQSREIAAGHIGMMAGGRAESLLWHPLRQWLEAGPRKSL